MAGSRLTKSEKKKTKEAKAAKQKQSKRKSVDKEKRLKQRRDAERRRVAELMRMTPEVVPDEGLTAMERDVAESKPTKPGKKKDKQKPSKQKSKDKEKKLRKRKEAELRRIAAIMRMTPEATPDEGATTRDTDAVEPKPKKRGRKGGHKRAKEEKAAKRKRAKDKAAAAEKPARDEVEVQETVPAKKRMKAKKSKRTEPKPAQSELKAAKIEVKDQEAAKQKQAKYESSAKQKAAKRQRAVAEVAAAPTAVTAEAVPAETAPGGSDDAGGGKRDEPGTRDTVREVEVATRPPPAAPSIATLPAAERAPASPSRFWPKVALGTAVVIAGFGAIRHMVKDQGFEKPGAMVTAGSEGPLATADHPAVTEGAVATRRPSPAPVNKVESPVATDQERAPPPHERPGAADDPERVAIADQIGSGDTDTRSTGESEPPAVAPAEGGSPRLAQEAAAQSAVDLETDRVDTRPMAGRKPAAQHRLVRPWARTEMARWPMARPYQPHRPQYRQAYPSYPAYICPVEPRVWWYPGSTAQGRAADAK